MLEEEKVPKESTLEKAKGYYVKIYDNWYINRLFPEIKQQKPGYDFYSYIFSV
jgi:hypothetical protein